MQRPVPRRHLDVMFQLRRFLGQLQEIRPIQPQRLDRRTAAHGRVAGPAFGEGRLTEAVARLQGREHDFIPVLVRLHHPGAAGEEDVKSVRRFALPNEEIAELVTFLLEQGTNLLEVLVRQKLKERRTPQEILVARFHVVRREESATG